MREYGHMGPVDTIFALSRAIDGSRIFPGALVVLASSGLGFFWGATALKF
jgi:3-oxoacyl-[acyl-carrier-protein] synthase-3